MTLRIATRRSPLALWQAEHVASLVRSVAPEIEVELIPSDTFGDRRQDLAIPELGGKGVFSKEIQAMVLAGEADIAVHSAKDLQAVTPEGLRLVAIPERGDPRDALVGARLAELNPGATVATGSNRRVALLRSMRPDLNIVGLRGNIATRLSKLDDGSGIDAIVMAQAALERLGLTPAVVEAFPVDRCVPQVGQAALAVEARIDDAATCELVAKINHAPSSVTVLAERQFLQELGGDCNLPAGAYAELLDGSDDPSEAKVRVLGVLAADDTTGLQRQEVVGLAGDEPGRQLARRLRSALGTN